MGFQHKNSYRQCSAKSKRSGKQCKNSAMKGRNVCRMHGGKSHRGIHSKHHYHGYYAKDAYSRLIWWTIKGIWRDCVQTMRLATARYNQPDKLQPHHWQRYKHETMHAMRKPIPDIPKDLYPVLWDTFEQGQSDTVKQVIRDYLINKNLHLSTIK